MDLVGLGIELLPVFKKIYESRQWNDMFVKIGSGILGSELDQGELKDQIEILFSNENLKEIAKNNVQSGYELLNQVKTTLEGYFAQYELYSEERKRYIDAFINCLKDTIKSEFPDYYDKIFLAELRDENNEAHSNMGNQLSCLGNTVISVMNEVKKLQASFLNVRTCSDLNDWYTRNTRHGCSLELFNHENNEFVNELLDRLTTSNEHINIKGENVFETVAYISYIIINDNRFKDYKNKLLIVDDELSWNKIEKHNLVNNIIINRFNNNEHIDVIENNRCIFVYGKNDFLKQKNELILEKRYFRNLVDKLKISGFGDMESHEVASVSRNNYTILMRNIGINKQKKPFWAEVSNYQKLLPMLIINKWEDSDRDNFDLLLATGMDYNEYLGIVDVINSEEDPFYVINKQWTGRNKYIVADIEAAWDFFSKSIDESLFSKIEPLMELIICGIDPKFDLPLEHHYFANVIGYVPEFSDSLKNGFLEVLILLSKIESPIKHKIIGKVQEILNGIDDHKKWFAISDKITSLVEINTEAVISTLENELLKEESGVINLFAKKSNDIFTGSNYYTHIIWALEKALYIEGYDYRAINLLAKLMDKDVKHSLSNSPLDTLYNALVAWHHDFIYSVEDKIKYVRHIVENTNRGWLLLGKLLPSTSGGSVSSLSKPAHIDYYLNKELMNNQQIYNTYSEYYNIALENMNDSVSNLCVLFQNTLFFSFDVFEQLKAITKTILEKSTDEEKYKVYKAIYILISRNRRYKGSNWSADQKSIDKLEKEVLEKISFDDTSYLYQHIFESYHDILLNPPEYKNNDNSMSINENSKLEDELRSISFEKLRSLDTNWCEFIVRFDDNSPNYIGTHLSKLDLDIDFIEKISNCLLLNGKISILSAYYNGLYNQYGVSIIDLFLKSVFLRQNEYISLLFGRIKITEEILAYLDAVKEEYRAIFWLNNSDYTDNFELNELIFDNFIRYDNIRSALELASRSSFSVTKYIIVLEKIVEKKLNIVNIMQYDIENVFEKIYNFDFPLVNQAETIMKLEIYFMKILDSNSELRYLRYILSNDPLFVADLVSHAFKKENEDDSVLNEKEKNLAEISHYILSSVKFSPTNKGEGRIDYFELRQWCEKFLTATSSNDQKKVGLVYIGHFLANTNKFADEYPQDSVKRVIEEIYSDEIMRGFSIEIYNRGGVRTIGEGLSMKVESEKYRQYAKNSKQYPRTQNILNRIADNFYRDYKSENESAKHEY